MRLIVVQRDLGAALLMFGIFVGMLYLGSARLVYVILGGVLFGGGAVLCAHSFPHVAVRIALWWNPWQDVDGKGYQIVQGLYALGAGGVFGTGLGQGAAQFVPAVHTDLVFVAAAEQLGLLGAAALLCCYALMVVRGLRLAQQSRNAVNALLAAGLSLAFGLQTLVILAGVMKLTPLTGVTLPFMSYGGSSLVANCLLIGFLLSISAEEAAITPEPR
jgi:cell division protein FtsW